jgi:hypothetical protein
MSVHTKFDNLIPGIASVCHCDESGQLTFAWATDQMSRSLPAAEQAVSVCGEWRISIEFCVQIGNSASDNGSPVNIGSRRMR